MRNNFSIVLLLLFLVSCTQEQAQPNVLFIAVDDLRPEVGAYGSTIAITPNLDELASKGTIFKNHFVQVPTCGASRYSMLIGMRPRTRQHLQNNVMYREFAGKAEDSLPETFIHQFKRNGYYTVGIGKISHSADGLVYGYEEEVSTKRELPHSWDELVFDAGKWNTGWNAFFAYSNGENRQSLKRQVKPYENAEVNDRGYPDGLTAELAVKKLKELKQKKKPFFMGVGFFKPHLPFNAPQKYWDLYERDKIPLSPNGKIPQNIDNNSLHNSGELNGYQLTDEKAGLEQPLSNAYAKKIRHAYLASVSYVDAQIGKVLTELKKQGLAKNTIVVVWGDHGWHLGDQQTWGKHTLFENALKSALIIKDPRNTSHKKTVESIVESVDIYPTLLELCNVPLSHSTDGESLKKAIYENGPDREGFAYSYFKNGISLRTKKYRLTKYYRKTEPTIELYNHNKDPHETINVASNYPEIVEQLLPKLEKGNTGLYQD